MLDARPTVIRELASKLQVDDILFYVYMWQVSYFLPASTLSVASCVESDKDVLFLARLSSK